VFSFVIIVSLFAIGGELGELPPSPLSKTFVGWTFTLPGVALKPKEYDSPGERSGFQGGWPTVYVLFTLEIFCALHMSVISYGRSNFTCQFFKVDAVVFFTVNLHNFHYSLYL